MYRARGGQTYSDEEILKNVIISEIGITFYVIPVEYSTY